MAGFMLTGMSARAGETMSVEEENAIIINEITQALRELVALAGKQ